MGDPYCLSDKRETLRSKYHHGISSVLLDHDSSRDNTHSHTGFLLVWAYCLLLHHYFFKNTNTARHFTSSTLHNAPDPYCPLPMIVLPFKSKAWSQRDSGFSFPI